MLSLLDNSFFSEINVFCTPFHYWCTRQSSLNQPALLCATVTWAEHHLSGRAAGTQTEGLLPKVVKTQPNPQSVQPLCCFLFSSTGVLFLLLVLVHKGGYTSVFSQHWMLSSLANYRQRNYRPVCVMAVFYFMKIQYVAHRQPQVVPQPSPINESALTIFLRYL